MRCRAACFLFARAVALACAASPAPLHAFVVESFPDQPGALSAQEIGAATAAMRVVAGEQPLPLVASGRREAGHPMAQYALFSAPAQVFAGRARARRQIVCNFMAAWNCAGPTDELRLSANGMEHLLYYEATTGAGDRQAAVDIVDYMYSKCFHADFAALGGSPFAPSADADYVSKVLDDGRGYDVGTGPRADGDSYRLSRKPKQEDGCAFRLEHARQQKSGAPRLLPESYAKAAAESAQQAAGLAQAESEQRARAQAEQARESARQRESTEEIIKLLWGLMVMVLVLMAAAMYMVHPYFLVPLAIAVLVLIVWTLRRRR